MLNRNFSVKIRDPSSESGLSITYLVHHYHIPEIQFSTFPPPVLQFTSPFRQHLAMHYLLLHFYASFLFINTVFFLPISFFSSLAISFLLSYLFTSFHSFFAFHSASSWNLFTLLINTIILIIIFVLSYWSGVGLCWGAT